MIQAVIGFMAVIATVIVTLNYYAQALICLERIEKLANACVPTILAVVLVYHIIKFIKSQAK